MQVQDYGQIQPPLAGPDITDITGPLLVRLICREVTIQQVRSHVERVIAVRGRLEFPCSFNDVRGLRPWRPCHARRLNLPGGDIALSWTRRTRAFAGDNWALTEVPLGEAAEGYEIDILNGATVVRSSAGLTAPAFTYTAAMQTDDFGAPVSGPLSVRIAQTGALGRGAILGITL